MTLSYKLAPSRITMVVTRAQEDFTSYVGGHPQRIEQQEATPSSPAALATPHEQLANLTQQVQALVGAVRELQEQRLVVTQRQPRPPTLPAAATPASK